MLISVTEIAVFFYTLLQIRCMYTDFLCPCYAVIKPMFQKWIINPLCVTKVNAESNLNLAIAGFVLVPEFSYVYTWFCSCSIIRFQCINATAICSCNPQFYVVYCFWSHFNIRSYLALYFHDLSI
jgi:hypothetical protein